VNLSNVIFVSDTHCGCKFGLLPPGKTPLIDGGPVMQSALQRKVWKWWLAFWNVWVPRATRGEPYAICLVGDIMDNEHHGSKTPISANRADQSNIAKRVWGPILRRAALLEKPLPVEGVEEKDWPCRHIYWVGGTEAHSGQSMEDEENLAREMGAIPDASGRFARYEINMQLGRCRIHATHHIGTTSSSQYESTALRAEMERQVAESAKAGDPPPDVIVRAHRHRALEVREITSLGGREGYRICFVLPGWQLKTPFVHRTTLGRVSPPQFGGSLVRAGDEEAYTRHRVWRMKGTKAVKL